MCCFGSASVYRSRRCQEVAVFRSKDSPGLVWCAVHAANFITSKMEKLEPRRIRLSRKKGWRMPEGAVKVDRTSRWGNPFRVGDRSPGNNRVVMDAEHACQCFRGMLEAKAEAGELEQYLAPLRGKDLACWCKDGEPCHADVLLEFANRVTGDGGDRKPETTV